MKNISLYRYIGFAIMFVLVTYTLTINLLASTASTLSSTIAITIDPQAYSGRYFIFDNSNPQLGPFTGVQTLNLVAGTYSLDDGIEVGGSSFAFDVSSAGQVTNITNSTAASANGSTLVLNNATINIDPVSYTGRYILLSSNTQETGPQSYTVIPGLLNGVDNNASVGSSNGQSYFRFEVGAGGMISNVEIAGAAYADGNTLRFNNQTLNIDPNGYTGSYNLSSHYIVHSYISGPHSFVLIPGLLYRFDKGNGTFESQFKFETNGTPTNIQPVSFAVGDGNTLVLFNTTSPSCPLHLPGLISEWRGEGNALDSVGTNNGTLLGTTTYTAGKIGQGFKFHDFFNDEVHVNFQVYNINGGTVSTWFKWDGTPTENWFSGEVLLGSWQGGNSSSPTAYIKFGTLWWDFSDSIFLGAASDTQIPIVPGSWYNLSITYDNNYVAKLYVNGALVASRNAANPGDFRDEFGIGRGPGIPAVGFSGVMDETQVYDRPLSACEINNLYNSANGAPCLVCDALVPVSSASLSATPNTAGWNNMNVTVTLSAADETGGSGVKNITYGTTGGQNIPPNTVSGSNVQFTITAEGQTTISYFATDNAGNVETIKTLVVKVDKTAPSVSCSPVDVAWHGQDVSLSCNASDGVSSLANAADESFSLVTNVAAGTENSNAATNSKQVCDVAGNCAVAGPVGGNKIDKKAPVITINAPISGSYFYNQAVNVNYICADAGSGVSACSGTTANGGLLNTGSIGSNTFNVNSADNAGSSTSKSVNYVVVYRVPTNKDECQNGGWQTLQRADGTLFSNQGQCVSYVNTGH